ncbi:hypothetical protein GCM10025864_33570 [Luteimicrobium album]|uniref:Uncharacterized protein n=1 Tax=Luteimicrobium album TaxID=1054550 RepID=A0ABQ6I6K9_9MICO|nr:hypothetical protein GCM10025864_33570 [Luteimicrobium album]
MSDPEPQRVDRHARLAQQLQPVRQRLARRVPLGGGRQTAQRALVVVADGQPGQLDERVPSLRVPGELLGERPLGEVGLPAPGRDRTLRREGSSSTCACEAWRRTISASAWKARSSLGFSDSTARSASSWTVSPRRRDELGRRVPTVDAEPDRRSS